MIQEGETKWDDRTGNHTANLRMKIILDPSDAGFNALNSLLEGLEKTGRRIPWGFSNWPLLDIGIPNTLVFGGKRSYTFKIDAALVNEDRKIIGAGSLTLNTGTMNFFPEDSIVHPPSGDMGLIHFTNVSVSDFKGKVTIVITAVNNIPSRDLIARGYMRIDEGDFEEWRYKFRAEQLPPLPTASKV